jgi:heterodisulfide reductase subunit A
MKDAGLNKYLFDMANIRNQGSWVHADEPEKATKRPRTWCAWPWPRPRCCSRLKRSTFPSPPAPPVIGGGISGMTAALELAKQGYPCHLVEQAPELGGNANKLRITASGMMCRPTWPGSKPRWRPRSLSRCTLDSKLAKVDGFVGNFTSTISGPDGETQVEHGATIITIGAKELPPPNTLYGQHPMVKTNLEIDAPIGGQP